MSFMINWRFFIGVDYPERLASGAIIPPLARPPIIGKVASPPTESKKTWGYSSLHNLESSSLKFGEP